MPGCLSKVCTLFSYSSVRTILFNDYNLIIWYFDLVGRVHSSLLFKKCQEGLVCSQAFTLADETRE